MQPAAICSTYNIRMLQMQTTHMLELHTQSFLQNAFPVRPACSPCWIGWKAAGLQASWHIKCTGLRVRQTS